MRPGVDNERVAASSSWIPLTGLGEIPAAAAARRRCERRASFAPSGGTKWLCQPGYPAICDVTGSTARSWSSSTPQRRVGPACAAGPCSPHHGRLRVCTSRVGSGVCRTSRLNLELSDDVSCVASRGQHHAAPPLTAPVYRVPQSLSANERRDRHSQPEKRHLPPPPPWARPPATADLPLPACAGPFCHQRVGHAIMNMTSRGLRGVFALITP
jgi:hypothetical protein